MNEPAAGDTAVGRSDRGLLLLLASCSALGPVATLLVLPALPVIRADFAVSTAATQTVISASLIAFAAGILVGGPLSDRYGRRPAMIGGLLLFLVGTLMCAVAPTMSAVPASPAALVSEPPSTSRSTLPAHAQRTPRPANAERP